MVQLVVMAVDQVNDDDFYLNCKLPRRGDVIECLADDFDLTKFPLCFNNPEWIVISIPGASVDDVQVFLDIEQDLNPAAKEDIAFSSQTLQFRSAGIDLGLLGLDEPMIIQAKADLAATGFLEARVALIVSEKEASAVPLKVLAAGPVLMLADKDPQISFDDAAATLSDPMVVEQVKEAALLAVPVVALSALLKARVDKQPIEDPARIGGVIAANPNLIG